MSTRTEGGVVWPSAWPRLRMVTAMLAAVAVLLGSGVIGAGPGAAQDAGVSRGGDADPAEAAIIVDASSSMLQPDEGGTRLDAAKRAATALVRDLPDTARIGMLAYGTQESDAPENREAGCRDIRTLAPVGAVDADRLVGEIEGLTARGYTPIGNALRAAADEMTGTGPRSIVLVSDGVDTCAPPDPCEVAADLADRGVELTVHAVGFKVDPAARAQLECITERTGGTFRQADDAAGLTDSLAFLTQRAIVGYETAGTPFTFADSPDEAEFLGEGLYQTRVMAQAVDADSASRRHVAIAVPEGHRAYVSGTVVPNTDLGAIGGGQQVNLIMDMENDAGGCSDAGTSDMALTFAGGFRPPAAALVTSGPPDEGCPPDRWRVGTRLLAEAGGIGGDVADEEVSVELSVQFEPVVAEASGFPDPGALDQTGDPTPVPIADPAQVEPGNSFNAATAVGEGTHRAAIVPGETHFYRVPVDWGRRPVVTLRTGESVRGEADALSVQISGPMRNEIGAAEVGFFDQPVNETTATVDRVIQFRNREEGDSGEERAFAGNHYIAVAMRGSGQDRGPQGVDQSYEFAVALDGEPAAGPTWRPVDRPGPPPTAGYGAGGTGSGRSAGGEAGPTAAGDDGGDTSAGTVAAIAGAAVLVVGAVVAAVAARRRRPGSDV